MYTAAKPTPLTTMPVTRPLRAGGNHLMAGGVVAEYPNPMPMPPTTPKQSTMAMGAVTNEESTRAEPRMIPPAMATKRGPILS